MTENEEIAAQEVAPLKRKAEEKAKKSAAQKAKMSNDDDHEMKPAAMLLNIDIEAKKAYINKNTDFLILAALLLWFSCRAGAKDVTDTEM
jgi:hypothetical protein